MATATTTGTPTVTTAATNYAWAKDVLGRVGGPTFQTDNNVTNMVAWMVSEEPPDNWWNNNNPLNIDAGGTGSDTFPSLDASAAETAKWISTYSNYTGIKNALANNAPYDQFKAAVVASPWAAGHYGNGSGFAAPGQPTVTFTGQTLSPGTAGNATLTAVTTHTPGTCDPNKYTINGPFGLKLLSQCSTKALAGGLCVGLGAITLGFGVLILVGFGLSATGAGKAAKQVVSAGPSGRAVKGVSSVAKRVGATTGLEARTRRRGNEQAARDEIDYARYEMDRPAREERNKRYRAEQGAAKRAGYDRVA